MTPTNPDVLLTVAEAARLVDRPRGTVASWVSEGKLAVAQWVKAVPKKRWRKRVAKSNRKPQRGKALVRPADVIACAARMDVAQGRNRGRHYEPTEEELERCVEEQMKVLPSWWESDFERMKSRPPNALKLIVAAVRAAREEPGRSSRRAA